MQYLLLIYENEKEWVGIPESEQKKVLDAYTVFTQDIIKSGHYKGGEALQPVSTATTVRVKGGKTVSTDGPFAETREQLGGFYLIDAKDLDDATKIAARIPAAKNGSIEIRPILKFDMPPA